MSVPAVFDAIAHTLADAHERFGAAAFTNRRRLIGLLSDHVADARREIRAVGTAIDEGVPRALAGSERHLIGMEMDRLAERLDATTGLRLDIARPIVRGFAYALGLGPLPSIYVATTPVPPPSPPADEWRGVSEVAAPAPAPVTQHPSAPVPPPPTPQPTADEDDDVFVIGGRAIPKTQAYLGGGGLLLVLAAFQLLGDKQPTAPQPRPAITDVTRPLPTNTGSTVQRLDYGQPVADQNYANETTDFGVPSQSTLESNVGSRTPLMVPGGRRITTAALQKMLSTEPSVVLIDVLDSQHDQTLRGAKFLPGAGNGGTVNDQLQPRVAAALAAVTDQRKARPIVFFCYGAECWESYNAVLRASAAGYINLYWYRGGIASWGAAGLPTDPTPAPPG